MRTHALYDIQTPTDYESAMAELGRVWGAEPGSEAAENRDILIAAISRYEESAYPSGPVTPVDIIQVYMDSRGREGRQQLNALVGGASRASEILNGKRRLTQKMIVALHRAWNIPYELLLEESESLPESIPSTALSAETRAGIEEAVRQAVAATVPGIVASAVKSALLEAGVTNAAS